MSFPAFAQNSTTEHASSTTPVSVSFVSTPAVAPVGDIFVESSTETIYSQNDTCSVHLPSFTMLPLLAALTSPFIRVIGCSYFMGGSSGPRERENQDNYSVTRIIFKGVEYVISVMCDGHGTYGKTFATETTRRLPPVILANFEAILANPLILQTIFPAVNEELRTVPFESSTLGACMSGGTTVALSILCDGRQIVANLADCEAVIHIADDLASVSLKQDGILQPPLTSPIVYLTQPHSPHDVSELLRVRSCGARIQHTGRPINADQDLGIYVQCPRSSLSLNLTRAFGDFRASFMSSTPTIHDITFKQGTLTKTIISSDGYSNCFTHTKPIHGYLAMAEQFTLSAAEICAVGRAEAGRVFGPTTADNTSILVLESGGPQVVCPVARPTKRVRFDVPDSPLPPPPPPSSPHQVDESPLSASPPCPRIGPPPPLRPLGAAVRPAV